jgi:hypothetical protein
VQVSLAQTGRWLRGLGRVPQGLQTPEPSADEVKALLEESESGFGPLAAVRHAGRLLDTPPRWSRPAVPLGTDAPVWD